MYELYDQPVETATTVAVPPPKEETPLQKGVTVSIIGVTIVFTSLIVIALFVKLLGNYFIRQEGKAAADNIDQGSDQIAIAGELSESELVAVITAALEAGGDLGKPFVIESIKMDRSFRG